MTKKRVNSSRVASQKVPQTMEELLATTDYQVKGLHRGETIVGKVAAIAGRTVFIDIGAKTEGVILDREYEAARDFIKNLKIGEEIVCQVYNPESDSGQILLSLKRTALSSAWQKLTQVKERNEEIEVLVSEVGRSGLMVSVFGLSGFLPNSQLGASLAGKTGELVRQRIKVKIIEADQENEKLIFSEKAVSEKEKMAQASQAMAKVKAGEEYEGTVIDLTNFGVFVQILVGKIPIEGLVHISEIAWEKVDDPHLMLKAGEKVKVKILNVDKEAGRLALSIKQLAKDPWLTLVAKYQPETHLKGKVSKLTAYGAFVEFEPGLTGLLHISKIPPEQKIEVGDEVACFVEGVEPDKRRLSLGLALTEKPVGYK